MRFSIAIVFVLEFLILAACRGEKTPTPTPTSTLTRTLIPSVTPLPPTATDTPYPTDTPTTRPPTNTLSATLTQTWPQTPTRTPTITRTPTRTPTGQPTPTITGTPPTATPTPTMTHTASGTGTPTPTATPTITPSPTLETSNALLWINPEVRTINQVGERAQVYLVLSDVSDVFALEVLLSFNEYSDIVAVVDAIQTESGIQIKPGNCPFPNEIVVNEVSALDNVIEYDVTQVAPTPSCNGGTVLIIEFECITAGTTTLNIDEAIIYNSDVEEIETTNHDGTITCYDQQPD